MLLQYPKLGGATAAHYEDYRRMHHDFIRVYKLLYEDIAGFSLLPEKFIKEAGPVIETYLNESPWSNSSPEQKMQLQVITDFISRFYGFMDEATEMFVEHQALCDKTVSYMETVSTLNKKHEGESISECEEYFVQLIPELQTLNEGLGKVREKVDVTSGDLNGLRPLWDKIKDKIVH